MFVDGRFQTFSAQGPLDYAAAMDFSPPENVLPTPPQFVMPDMQQAGAGMPSGDQFGDMGQGAGDLFRILNDSGAFGGGGAESTGSMVGSQAYGADIGGAVSGGTTGPVGGSTSASGLGGAGGAGGMAAFGPAIGMAAVPVAHKFALKQGWLPEGNKYGLAEETFKPGGLLSKGMFGQMPGFGGLFGGLG